MISSAAVREIHKLQHEADVILSQRSVSRADGKRADLIIAKIAAIRSAGRSSAEQRQLLANEISRESGLPQIDFDTESPEQRAHAELFRRFLKGDPDGTLLNAQEEMRSSFITGTQTPIFTSGTDGGCLVPVKFAEQVAEARAAVDPLFDSAIVSLVQEDGYTLPHLQIPGFDLTTCAAVKTSEGAQLNPQVIPNIDGRLTSRWTYRATFAGDMEFAEDSKAYGSAEAALARALGVSFARGCSQDLVVGDGVTGPQGALTGAVSCGYTTEVSGTVNLTDINNIFFSVNAAFRASPKCAFCMNDVTWKMCCSAVDNDGRPLLPIKEDELTLKGKPVLISPSMPTGAGSKGILFGDFASFYVHSSTLLIQRRNQYPGLVEFGKVAWTGLQMVDSVVFDPTEGANSGAFSPLKYLTLK